MPRIARIAMVSLLTATACWGGGSGEVTSFDRDTVLGDLGEADFGKLCRQIDDWSDRSYGNAEFKFEQCQIETALAIRLTRSGNVSDFFEQCKQDAEACYQARKGAPNLTHRCVRGPAHCARTVEALERCLTDRSYDLYTVFLGAPMCDDICRVFPRLKEDSASCVQFENDCPGWLFTSRPGFPLLESPVPRCGATP
jgi:hypothetical protein